MDALPLRDLFSQYAGALAYIAVRDDKGDEHIGSAFHIGDGVFVTARHVVQAQTILEIATTARVEVVVESPAVDGDEVSTTVHFVEPRVLEVAEGPYFHANDAVDVAVFRVNGVDPRAPRVPLGFTLDDDIEDHSFVLTEALVLGFPPVPNTNVPRLIAARAEVNAVIDARHAPYAHFVVSAMARGGFSGGLVLSEFGHALGLVTESLVRHDMPPELGYMTVLSVEPIYACVAQHFELPVELHAVAYVRDCTRRYRLTDAKTSRLNPRLANAMVSVYDDDRDVFMELSCPDSVSLRAAYCAMKQITPVEIVESQSRPGYLFVLPTGNPSSEVLERAALAAVYAFKQMGYLPTARNY